MPTDMLERLQDETRRLGGAERKKRLGELWDAFERVQETAQRLAEISEMKQSLVGLLERIRAAVEELRAVTEGQIAAVLALADEATRVWKAMWEAALGDPAKDRAKGAEMLRWVLEDAGQTLQEVLRRSQRHAHMFEQPLARLDELEARAAEFPLWVRECLARWEMLDRPVPPLDPERIARAQAAYAQGEHEDVADVLSRVEAGGPWVKE